MGLVGFNLCNFCSRNVDYLLIGRFLGTRELGLYTIAYRLMLYPLHNISAVMGRIMFPVLAQVNEDLPRFRRGYLAAIGSIALASFPMMTGLIVTADLLVPVVLGLQWKPVVPLIQILAFVGLIQSIGTTVGSIYQAKDRTDLLLKWGLLSSALTVLSFAIGLNWGTIGVASAYAVVSVALAVPGVLIPFRLIGLELFEFTSRLWRPGVCSLLMGGLVLLVRPVFEAVCAPRESLIFSVVSGLLAYCVLSWWINQASIRQSFEAAGVSLLPKARGAVRG
jgi:PST family polysaccharide transporter